LIALFLTASLLAAPAADAQDIPNDTFVMSIPSAPWSLDPGIVFRVVESRVVHNLYEGLYMPPAADGPPVPGVATAYEVSEDGTTYTFHLRDNAMWSNGDPVTALDFVIAWRRVLDPEIHSQYAYLMYYLKNGRAYANGEVPVEEVGVRALGDHTLEVELEGPVPFFVQLTAFPNFFPVHAQSVLEHGNLEAFYIDNLITNGPYEIDEYNPESEITLAQNPHYWDRAALRIEHIRTVILEDPADSLAAYHDGAIEWTGDIPWDSIPALRPRDDFRTHALFGTYYFRLNVNHELLSDVRVRRALSMAIDREALCRDVLDGLCGVATSFVPPLPGYEPINGLIFDPEGARALLAEAGYEGGEGVPAIGILYNTLDMHERIARAVSEMWRSHLNVTTELEETNWDTYMERLNTTTYQVARFGWIGDYLDPDSFLFLMVSSNTQMNGGWSNTAYDALVAQAARETDPSARAGFIHGAEGLLLEQLPVIPLFYYTQMALVRPNISGFYMNLRDVHLVRYISKD
jgi:oligopeptide transport system substrate-binding protein